MHPDQGYGVGSTHQDMEDEVGLTPIARHQRNKRPATGLFSFNRETINDRIRRDKESGIKDMSLHKEPNNDN